MKGGAVATTREKHSGLPIGEPVLGLRRSAFDEKLPGTLQKLAIGDARPFVLAQVLHPRFVHETFHVTRGIGRVVKQLPEIRPVAAAHFAYCLHRGHEFGPPGGLHVGRQLPEAAEYLHRISHGVRAHERRDRHQSGRHDSAIGQRFSCAHHVNSRDRVAQL